MTSLVARASLGLSKMMRGMGASLDSMGKGMEVTKYTEKLVPSTRFVAVDNVAPKVAGESFIAPSASIVGDVTIGQGTSIWYGAVVRGDVNNVTIGDHCSIGDRAVVHVAKIQGDFPTSIGNGVSVGAGAIVHAATLKDACVIGEGAQVLDGAVVEAQAMVAPASVVTPGTTVAAGELWSGSPAKKVRELSAEEISAQEDLVRETVELAAMHAYEHTKDYKQVTLEEDEEYIQEHYKDPAVPSPTGEDLEGVLGQGAPGRIFRSTLSHPYEGYKGGLAFDKDSRKNEETA